MGCLGSNCSFQLKNFSPSSAGTGADCSWRNRRLLGDNREAARGRWELKDEQWAVVEPVLRPGDAI